MFTTLCSLHKKAAYSTNILVTTKHTIQFHNSKFHNVYLKPKRKIFEMCSVLEFKQNFLSNLQCKLIISVSFRK